MGATLKEETSTIVPFLCRMRFSIGKESRAQFLRSKGLLQIRNPATLIEISSALKLRSKLNRLCQTKESAVLGSICLRSSSQKTALLSLVLRAPKIIEPSGAANVRSAGCNGSI